MNTQTLVSLTTELMTTELNKFEDVEFETHGKYLTVKRGNDNIEVIIENDQAVITHKKIELVATSTLMASHVIMSILNTIISKIKQIDQPKKK